MCIIAPVSPIGRDHTRAQCRASDPHERERCHIPGIRIEPKIIVLSLPQEYYVRAFRQVELNLWLFEFHKTPRLRCARPGCLLAEGLPMLCTIFSRWTHQEGAYDTTRFAQFIALCRRSKWSKHVTNSPLLALLAMPGSTAARKLSSACSQAFC